jgi:hypothetical protein
MMQMAILSHYSFFLFLFFSIGEENMRKLVDNPSCRILK